MYNDGKWAQGRPSPGRYRVCDEAIFIIAERAARVRADGGASRPHHGRAAARPTRGRSSRISGVDMCSTR